MDPSHIPPQNSGMVGKCFQINRDGNLQNYFIVSYKKASKCKQKKPNITSKESKLFSISTKAISLRWTGIFYWKTSATSTIWSCLQTIPIRSTKYTQRKIRHLWHLSLPLWSNRPPYPLRRPIGTIRSLLLGRRTLDLLR